MQFKNLLKNHQRYILKSACVASFFIAIFSCNTKNEKETNAGSDTMDSAQTAASIVTEDSAVIFENTGDLRNTTFTTVKNNWSRFKLKDYWYIDSLQPKPYEADKSFYTDYDSLLKWSADSSYILDIGTYGMMAVKDKQGKNRLESGEADTEIALLDPKHKLRTRLMFAGPGMSIEAAQWVDSNQVAILGTFVEDADNKPDTTLWIINAKDKFFKKYELK